MTPSITPSLPPIELRRSDTKAAPHDGVAYVRSANLRLPENSALETAGRNGITPFTSSEEARRVAIGEEEASSRTIGSM